MTLTFDAKVRRRRMYTLGSVKLYYICDGRDSVLNLK